MKNRFIVLLVGCLILLVAAVFIVSGALERRRYHASIKIVESDSLQLLDAESQNIRERLRAAEHDLFALFEIPDLDPAESIFKGLYLFNDGAFSPYRLSYNKDHSLPDQSLDALRLARELSSFCTNMAAPFRIAFRSNVLSVDARGQACLLPIDIFRGKDPDRSPIMVDTYPPAGGARLLRQLRYPPVVVWMPDSVFAERRQPVERAYIMTNVMLAVMFVLLVGVGTGIVYISRRGHEMANLKSAFVSAVSHELRTPMALIRLYAESMAADSPPPGARERYAKSIVAETDRLLTLVNNVLDFSKMEKGLLRVECVEVDISKICSEALDLFKFRLERENISLVRSIEPGLAALADPVAATQIIFNLVDNAVTYSEAGSSVAVELARDGGRVRLHVKDNGAGIDDALKPHVFTPFVRGTDSRITSKRGTGLGLHVVSQLVERMKCTVRIYDNVPAGTVVEVTFPAPGSIRDSEAQA